MTNDNKPSVATAVPFSLHQQETIEGGDPLNNIDINPEDLQRELRNEYEALDDTLERYQISLENTLARNQGSETLPARFLISKLTSTFTEVIKDFIDPIEKPRGWNGGTKGQVRGLLNGLKLSPEQLAFATLKAVLDTVCHSKCNSASMTTVIQTISRYCIQTHEVQEFKKACPEEFNSILRGQKEKGVFSKTHLYRVLSVARGRLIAKGEKDYCSIEEGAQLGNKLLDLLITSTGAFEHILKVMSKTKKERIVQATKETNKILNESPELFAFMMPMYPIMLCPPKPWTNIEEGGYWLGDKLQAPFIKQPNKILKKYAEDFSIDSIPKVYEAVNHAQKTPWKINTKVLEVLDYIWNDLKGGIAGIPSKSISQAPPKPWGKLTDEEFKEYKKDHLEEVMTWTSKASNIHNENHKNTLKRCIVRRKLEIAHKYKNEKTVYFPYNLDFRGRLYPLPAYVNPQGDDTGKALIHFAEGKPLKNQKGVDWLAIHGANLAGVDKVSFKERIAWIKENESLVLQSAKRPLECLWWANLKGDKPFQFLAFCFEWTEYKEKGIKDFISHLPIAQDGTCNGLQHLSAMLLDKRGGEAVNLVKNDTPADIYTTVLNKTRELIENDIKATEDKTEKLIGSLWLKDNNLNRNVVKRPVMTTPYGVKIFGIHDQIAEWAKKLLEKNNYTIGLGALVKYLSKHLMRAIDEVISSANEAMDYLKILAKMYCKDTQDLIKWNVPITNFKVLQRYYIPNTKRIDIYQGSQRIQLSVSEDVFLRINTSKQVSGVSPNFIHSLDAAMLMQTVLKAKASKIDSLALIHDSYATHACNSELLSKLLRESFVDLYTREGGNVLEGLRGQLQKRLKDRTLQLPLVPSRGKLDIYETMNSSYFFS